MRNMKTNSTASNKLAILSIVSVALAFVPSAFAGYGSSAKAPVCDNSRPGTPTFSYVRPFGTDQIELGWGQTERATSWTIAYGNQSGRYIYGMSDFGDYNSRSVHIGLLPVGTYYVVIRSNNGCMPGGFSPERMITVTAGGNVYGTSTANPAYVPVVDWNMGTTPTASPTASPEVSPTEMVTPTPTPVEVVVEEPKRSWLSQFFHNLVNAIFGK